MSKQELLDLIDKAGKGSIEAAEAIAEGYFKGSFDGKKNLEKAVLQKIIRQKSFPARRILQKNDQSAGRAETRLNLLKP